MQAFLRDAIENLEVSVTARCASSTVATFSQDNPGSCTSPAVAGSGRDDGFIQRFSRQRSGGHAAGGGLEVTQ